MIRIFSADSTEPVGGGGGGGAVDIFDAGTHSIPGGLTGCNSSQLVVNHNKGKFASNLLVRMSGASDSILDDANFDGATCRGAQISSQTLNSATVSFYKIRIRSSL